MATRRPKRPRDPNQLGMLTGNMLNPLKWKPEHRVALLVASVAGGALGVAFAYSREWGKSSFTEWIEYKSADALFWALIGAIVVGAATYCSRVFSN